MYIISICNQQPNFLKTATFSQNALSLKVVFNFFIRFSYILRVFPEFCLSYTLPNQFRKYENNTLYQCEYHRINTRAEDSECLYILPTYAISNHLDKTGLFDSPC